MCLDSPGYAPKKKAAVVLHNCQETNAKVTTRHVSLAKLYSIFANTLKQRTHVMGAPDNCVFISHRL